MRDIFILIFTCCIFPCTAQHCPWDCTGMIIFETTLGKEAVYAVNPVLVDENKHPITDTIFGTGREDKTNDLCQFLYYDDFLANRKEKIKIHHWYQYDTLYGFAEGKFLVKYNFCRYRNTKLYIRYKDRHTRDLRYHYIEVPENMRIHLHNYNNLLREENKETLKKELQPFVLQPYLQ